MDLSKDKIFADIDGLKWLLYVGENYFNGNMKILVIGESHYHEENKESIRLNNEIGFTRKMLTDFAIKRNYWRTKIFQNFYKVLFRTDKINSIELWKNLAFYNFIQRSMTNNKSRPNESDLKKGWLTSFQLIELLKPNVCIFIGVESSKYLHSVIKKSEFRISNFREDLKISNTKPRKAILIDKFGNEIKLIFIQHTSQYFSWDKWNKYLKTEIGNEISFLKKISTAE